MARQDNKRRLTRSVIARLLESPGGELPFQTPRGEDLPRLKNEVAADLENLLNTRCRSKVPPPQLSDVQKSLIDYGIPDFTGLNMSLPTERERIRIEIERAIRRFEPRLKTVIVSVQANAEKH